MEFCALVSLLGKQGDSETLTSVYILLRCHGSGQKVCVGAAGLFQLSIGVVNVCHHHGLEFDVEVDN